MSAYSIHLVTSGRVSAATAWKGAKESFIERLRRHTQLNCCGQQETAALASETVQGWTVGCWLIVIILAYLSALALRVSYFQLTGCVCLGQISIFEQNPSVLW